MTKVEEFAEIRKEFLVNMLDKHYSHIANVIRFNDMRVAKYKLIPVGSGEKLRYITTSYGSGIYDILAKDINDKLSTLDWLPMPMRRVCDSIMFSLLELVSERLDKELAGELDDELNEESDDEILDIESDDKS